MAHYLIKNSDNKTILLKQFDLNDSFSFNPKMKDNAKIKITEINIIDKKIAIFFIIFLLSARSC